MTQTNYISSSNKPRIV